MVKREDRAVDGKIFPSPKVQNQKRETSHLDATGVLRPGQAPCHQQQSRHRIPNKACAAEGTPPAPPCRQAGQAWGQAPGRHTGWVAATRKWCVTQSHVNRNGPNLHRRQREHLLSARSMASSQRGGHQRQAVPSTVSEGRNQSSVTRTRSFCKLETGVSRDAPQPLGGDNDADRMTSRCQQAGGSCDGHARKQGRTVLEVWVRVGRAETP